MRCLLLTSCTAATVVASAAFFAPHPAHSMTIATPAGLSAAIRQSDVKQDVYWRRAYGGYSYYRPYAYPFAYRPYYSYAYRPYAYAYRPYAYAYRPYAYAYRPYAYSYAYRPYAYRSYAYGGYGPRLWLGWGRRW